jgi:putative chitinase
MDLTKLKGYVPDSVYDLLPAAFERYGVDTVQRAAHFLGQVAHESGGFKIKTESLYYSTAARIAAVWPSRFNLDGSNGKKNANDYTKNAQKLAEAVYAGRMGNTQPGDAFRYRGGGFLQLTGKDAYKSYADYIKQEIGKTADMIRSDDYYALDCALYEYAVKMKLNATADQGVTDDVTRKITKVINGGYIGLPDRIVKVKNFYNILTA